MIELILGGARSGKSAYAEVLASADGRPVTYVATAEAGDAEMTARIAHHRQRRPGHWQLVEAPRGLAAALQGCAAAEGVVLVDCLTLWLSNALLAGWRDDAPGPDTAVWDAERDALLAVLPELPGRTVLVSNEVGWGIVPLGALSRRFCDEQGRLNQAVAALADRVTLVAAGLPLHLKAVPSA